MDNKKVYTSLIIAALLWGFATPIGKYVVEYMPVPAIIYLRFVISAIIVGIVAIALRVDFRFTKQEFKIISIAGITTALTMTFFYSSLNYITATEASILYNTVPIVTVLATLIIIKNKPSKFDLVGIILAFVGTILIIGRPFFLEGATATLSTIGVILMLLAVCSNVATSFVSNKIPKEINIFKVMFVIFTIGTLISFPFIVKDATTDLTWINNISVYAVLGMIYIALCATLIPSILFTYGVERAQPSQVNVFSFIQPVAALLLAIPLLGESLDLYLIIGMLTIFGGIYIATRDDEQQAQELHKRTSGKYHKHL